MKNLNFEKKGTVSDDNILKNDIEIEKLLGKDENNRTFEGFKKLPNEYEKLEEVLFIYTKKLIQKL